MEGPEGDGIDPAPERYAWRQFHPFSSGGMFVLVEDSAQPLVSSYVQAGDLAWIGDRWRQGTQRPGVGDLLVGPVGVVGGFELTQYVEEVVLVPDQGGVEEFTAADF